MYHGHDADSPFSGRAETIVKWLPNTLSIFRMVLSLSLIFVEGKEVGFIVLYALCGLTDWADGFIARKLNCVTTLGARLDSIADLTFSFVLLYLIYSHQWLRLNSLLIVCLLLIAGIRIMNMMITGIKFRRWNVMHTIANKMTGLVIFLFLPFLFRYSQVPTIAGIFIMVLALWSSLEETCILLFFDFYDVDRRSIFHRQ